MEKEEAEGPHLKVKVASVDSTNAKKDNQLLLKGEELKNDGELILVS
jgi:hypothetical protein